MRPSLENKPVSPEAMTLGYEAADIRARGFVVFLILFIASMLALHILLWWTMKRIERHAMKTDVPRSAMRNDVGPPPPNLQPSAEHNMSDAQDLEAMKQQEDSVFTRFGWKVNPATHDVEIPASVVQAVIERERSASRSILPTTTGKDFNSIKGKEGQR